MILTGNNCETITVESSVITTVAADVGLYDDIVITITTDCGDSNEVTVATPFSDTGAEAYLDVDGNLILNPSVLGAGVTTFADAVYTVNIKANRTGNAGFDEDEGCFFNDCETACNVSEYITLLLKDKPDMRVHMLHFALIEGSNCGCNCSELCDAWAKLQELLTGAGIGGTGGATDNQCINC